MQQKLTGAICQFRELAQMWIYAKLFIVPPKVQQIICWHQISASRIFSADIRLTKIRRLSQISAAAGGSIQMGITEPTTSPYFNLNDKNAEKRLVVDLRAVNPLTVTGGRNYPQTSFFACCSANSWNLKKMLW